MSERLNAPSLVILLVLAMIGWGGSWTSGKVASSLAQPEIIIFWRFLITVLSMVPLMVFQRESMRVSKKTFLWLLCAAVVLIAYNMFFLFGVRTGYAGAGGVLVTTLNPVMTLIWTSLFFRKRPWRLQILGLFLGLVGGAIILNIWKISYQNLLDSGNAFFLLAPMSWSLLTVLSQKIQRQLSFTVFSFYVYAFATVISFPLAYIHGLWPVSEHAVLLWSNIVFLAIVATSFGATVYFLASSRLGSQKASSFTFLVPVIAVLISWLILDEKPLLTTIIGGALSITAVQLINMKRRAQASGA
jgi:drug/metabolite transporter (DMT)-like permease